MGHPHRHGRIPQPVTPTPHASRGPTKTHRTTTRTHHSVMTHTGHPATAGSLPDCRRNWGQHEHRSFVYCTVLLTYHDRWSAGGLSRWAWTMSECSAGGLSNSTSVERPPPWRQKTQRPRGLSSGGDSSATRSTALTPPRSGAQQGRPLAARSTVNVQRPLGVPVATWTHRRRCGFPVGTPRFRRSNTWTEHRGPGRTPARTRLC